MTIPQQIQVILEKLEQAGVEAYLVGGCVRDLLMNKAPKDWDITTNARPTQIIKIFPDAKYENEFGTVLVKISEEKREKNLKYVEITTYRSEQGYSDRRHPDEIKFEDSWDKDLERRDFTINAMAISSTPQAPLPKGEGERGARGEGGNDLFGGPKDIKKKIIRAGGEPADRFKEDALRMMRAVRLAVELNFELEPKTARAIIKLAGAIKFVSKERVHDELVKILQSDYPAEGMLLLHQTKLLRYIIPELEEGVGVAQNKHHPYTVFKHAIESLRYTKNKFYQVRLASLLHDIAKPKTKRGQGTEATFYNHYNVGEVTAASVRRLINKVGRENLQDLIDLRVADRLGSGTPKAMPYKLRHLQYMFKKVQNDPVSVKMLKINGDDLIKILKIKPGPKIGAILDVLLSEVLEDAELKTKEYLEKRSKELNKLELNELRGKAKIVIEEKREQDDKKIKEEFWVK